MRLEMKILVSVKFYLVQVLRPEIKILLNVKKFLVQQLISPEILYLNFVNFFHVQIQVGSKEILILVPAKKFLVMELRLEILPLKFVKKFLVRIIGRPEIRLLKSVMY
jgi:hypothetical protein